MSKMRLTLLAMVAVFGLAACGDTWRGVKEDTKENTQAVGRGIERAGEKIQEQAQ
jgi:predicted small secreted protein